MTGFIFLITIAFCFSVAMLAFSYVEYRNKQDEVKEHLGADKVEQVKKKRFQNLGLLIQWCERFAPVGEKVQLLSEPAELEDHLLKAGYPYDLSIRDIQGAKILLALIGLLLVLPGRRFGA